MKTNMNQTPGRRLAGACFATLLLTAAASAWAQSTFKSPVGTWDVVISGNQGIGVAYLTFYDDYTFSGSELLTIKDRKSKVATDPRYLIEYGRNFSSTTNNLDSGSATNLYGYTELSGPWNYDSSGNVIGHFVEKVGDEGSTNVSLNPVSFKAKVVPGKRLTMTATTPGGKVTYRGVAYNEEKIPDLTGSWYGMQTAGSLKTYEFFDLTPDASPFLFLIDGNGPGYTYVGYSMVSSQKYVGFTTLVTAENGTDSVLRSVVGSFSPRYMKASTKGVEDGPKYISFSARKLPEPVE
jgi:hypothetical protein